MLEHDRFLNIVETYRKDPESVFQTWFINGADRLKAFRSIRRGVEQVVDDIRADRFGNDFRGSSLEFVLGCITEQKQVFEGAAHAFYWKPKLRIPDIYENDANKKAFGQFLNSCLSATREDQLLREIVRLTKLNIKGLGPAVANILYFLHPTLLPPFNTAMLNGFNLLFGTKNKLGSWTSYLEIRDLMLDVNERHRQVLSRDLGAIAGLMFEVGSGKLVVEENAETVLEEVERRRVEWLRKRRHVEVEDDLKQSQAHTQMQFLLSRIGAALGYDVFVAANDRSRCFDGNPLSEICMAALPPLHVDDEVAGTIELIDILWIEKNGGRIVGAFEVEKSTSIYSGILRLHDLALALPDHQTRLCLVVPDSREKEVIAQLKRPSLIATNRQPSYLLFSDLSQHCDAICRFGADHHVLDKISRTVHLPPRSERSGSASGTPASDG